MNEIYENLETWQKAQALCLRMYKLTNNFQSKERAEIFRKIRKTSELIPMKIAAGSMSICMSEYIDNLKDSYHNIIRLKSEVAISRHLNYLRNDDTEIELDSDLKELDDLLHSFIKSLEVQDAALNTDFAYNFPPCLVN